MALLPTPMHIHLPLSLTLSITQTHTLCFSCNHKLVICLFNSSGFIFHLYTQSFAYHVLQFYLAAFLLFYFPSLSLSLSLFLSLSCCCCRSSYLSNFYNHVAFFSRDGLFYFILSSCQSDQIGQFLQFRQPFKTFGKN